MNRLMIAVDAIELIRDDIGATENCFFDTKEKLKKAQELHNKKEFERLSLELEVLNKNLGILEDKLDNLLEEAYKYLRGLPEEIRKSEGVLAFKFIAIDFYSFEDVAEYMKLPMEDVLELYNNAWVILNNLRI